MLDNDADPILIISVHHQLLYANPNAERLFGQGELNRGAPIGELLERTVPTFSITESSSSVHSGQEHRFSSPSGVSSLVQIEVSVIERSRGVTAGLCLRLRDRTALRTAMDEAEERLSLLQALDLAIGEGILFKERGGAIRYVNDAFANLWGMSTQEMLDIGPGLQVQLGTKLREPPPKSMQRMWNHQGVGFSSSQVESADVTMLDGTILEVRTLPITTEQEFFGRAWRMTDVTQARRESQAMIQSQKMEGLGLLAGGIAHDFNNLLMTVLGNTEIAREGVEADSSIQGPLADVEAAAKTAAELTSQLLAYAGKAAFTTESLDLSVLVREVTNLVSVTIPKKIEIDFDLEKELPLVRGGSAQLRQVLMNLLTNASDAIGDAQGKIEIRTGLGWPLPMEAASAVIDHGEVSGDIVHVSVRDDGAGMDDATLAKIFDPLFTTKFTGRGLGLAATRGILDSHKGQLKIETKLGLGSQFTFVLPLQEPTRPAAKRVPLTQAPDQFANQDVLIVDDEASIRAILAKHLSGAGFNIHVASNGEQALAAVDRMGPTLSLVILDIAMPGLSGIETWTQLRKKKAYLPIIMSSGHPEEALDQLEGWNPAYDGFIQKPYRNQTLLENVESLLNLGEK